MRRRRAGIARTCALWALAALAGSERSASASEPAPIVVRITEELHEGCPRSPTMLTRLRARLPRIREAEAGEAAVSVDVRVEQRRGMSHGAITLAAGGERAERAAASASCERVLSALAVMAVIGLEGGEVPLASAPDRTPMPPVAPEPKPSAQYEASSLPPTPPRPRPAVPEARAPLGVAVGTSFEISANHALVLAPAFFGQITFPGRFVPVLRIGVARSFRRDVVSDWGTVALRWSEVTLTGCGDVAGRAALRIGPCLNIDAGVLDAAVVKPLPSRTGTAFWLSAGASARIAWRPLRALSFEAFGGLRVPVIRNQLLFEPAALVYEAPAVVPFVGTAVVAHVL